MSKTLKDSLEKLKFIASITDKNLQQKLLKFIAKSPKNKTEFDSNFKAIKEICCNYLNNNIPRNKKLDKYTKTMKKFTKRNLSKRIKEKLFIQNGGFLATLLPLVGSFLINQLT